MGVALIVAAVKRLATPYRQIVDAGVVVGLSWGATSIVLWYLREWWCMFRGKPGLVQTVDPETK